MRLWSLHKQLIVGESAWCLRVNRLCSRYGLRAVFSAISWLGDGPFWYAVMAAMSLFGGRTGVFAALHLAVTGVVTLVLYKRLKRWTRRPRPCASDVRIRAWVAPLDEFSFPSGHTLHAVAFSVIALAYYPGLAWLLIPFSASVAASRVILGLHYPSDVLAATAIGIFLGSVSLSLGSRVSVFT